MTLRQASLWQCMASAVAVLPSTAITSPTVPNPIRRTPKTAPSVSFLLTQLNTLANAAFEAIASIPNSFAQKSFLLLVYMTKSPNIFIETDAA